MIVLLCASAIGYSLPVTPPSEELKALLHNQTQTAASVDGESSRQWVRNGGSFQVDGQSAELERIGATGHMGRPPENICEIGFNAGHGTSALMLHNQATVQEFDTMGLPWSPRCFHALQDRFPGRLTLHKGSSATTVPAYAAEVARGAQPKCDVFYIDGVHKGLLVWADFWHALKSMREGGIIVADDTTPHWPEVEKAWQAHVQAGNILGPRCIAKMLTGALGWRGYCVGVRAPNITQVASRSSAFTAAVAPASAPNVTRGGGDEPPNVQSHGRMLAADGWPSSPFAYVTLTNRAYLKGLVALAASLADSRARWPLVVMYTSDEAGEPLLASTTACINASVHPTSLVRVPQIVNPAKRTVGRFVATYNKLNAFRAPVSRVVFLDSDALVLRNIDELFLRQEPPPFAFGMSAVGDEGEGCRTQTCVHTRFRQGLQGSHLFNSGVMVFEPSAATFGEMLESMNTLVSSDLSDQGFLNAFALQHATRRGVCAGVRSCWNHTFQRLPRSFNRIVRLDKLTLQSAVDDASVLHFVGTAKPWHVPRSGAAEGISSSATAVTALSNDGERDGAISSNGNSTAHATSGTCPCAALLRRRLSERPGAAAAVPEPRPSVAPVSELLARYFA